MMEKKKKDYKDFIDYESKLIVYLDLLQYKIIEKFFPIIKALRGKYLTVKEIHDLYFDEEIKKHKYTKKTIYRYLEELENAGLVVVAGHRVTKGSRVFEKLYSRTGKIFFHKKDDEYNKHKKEYYNKIVEKMHLVLCEIYNEPAVSLERFKEVFLPYFELHNNSIEKLIERVSKNQKLADLYSSMDIDSIKSINDNVGIINVFLSNPEILEELRKMFT